MKDLAQLLEKLNSEIDSLSARIATVEQSVQSSMIKAQKCERLMFGEPQPPAPRLLQPSSKGSIASKALGLG